MDDHKIHINVIGDATSLQAALKRVASERDRRQAVFETTRDYQRKELGKATNALFEPIRAGMKAICIPILKALTNAILFVTDFIKR